MNNELIKRIDDFLGEFGLSTKEWDLLNDCRAEIERLSKPYVPMTDDEISIMTAEWYDEDKALPLIQYVEAAVIKRAGLEIKHD